MELNEAKKQYAIDMHTAEHILNRTMVNIYGCPRSATSHIERKKSKCDYLLAQVPTDQEIEAISKQVNDVIAMNLAIREEFMTRDKAAALVDLSKLPTDASELLRIVHVGDYDACACIGQHVSNTNEIGRFEIISHDFDNNRWRVRFKLIK